MNWFTFVFFEFEVFAVGNMFKRLFRIVDGIQLDFAANRNILPEETNEFSINVKLRHSMLAH